MLIDWFTVIAQAANFLILVWLMKRFLYQPILDAIDARERRIAAELADAAAKEADAQAERETFRRKNEEFDHAHQARLTQAKEEAAAERQRLFEAVRQDAAQLREKQQNALHSEYQNLRDEIARRTRTEVFAIARRTLGDLADESLEARMAEMFVRRLRELDATEKQKLAPLLQTAPVLVRSAFELPAAQRELIEAALQDIATAQVSARFELAPAQVGGIELIAQGQKIAWSIGDYLATLEKNVNDLLKAPRQPDAREIKHP